MAERILRSPGVTTRELDLSAPGQVRPQGIPAGIIGTAQKGPAFVPVTFATLNDFTSLFGETEGKHFGAMAVREWMRNARSGLFLRVLGIGDGKKSASTGVVSRAGFIVGQDMRDKDNTAASQALSGADGQYAAVETDGAAHGSVKNPYAGAAVDDVMTKVVTEAGTVAVTADTEEGVTVTVKPSTTDNAAGTAFAAGNLAAFDGFYILVKNISDTKDYVFWCSTQAGRAIDGMTIKDGTYTVKDLAGIATESASIRIVDISADTTGTQVADAIKTSIGGVSGLTSTAVDNVIKINQSADGAGTFTRLTGSTGVSTVEAYNKSDVVDSVQVPVSASTAIGVTAVTGVDTIITITFNADNKPPVGSTVLVTMPDGSQTTITHATGSTVNATSLGIDADTAGNQSADAMALALRTISGVGCPAPAVSASALTITATITNGAALPTIAVTNNSPNAPAGSVFFLSVQSHASTGANIDGVTHYNDYLPLAASDIANPETPAGYERILRGVLMFPSGVMPGINSSSTAFDTADLPTAAYGTYASGKDLGASNHKGDVSSAGDFEIALNGFNNSSYDSTLKASFDVTSPIYLSKVFNTDPSKIQEKGHYLYAHYDVPNDLAQWYSHADAAMLQRGNLSVSDWTGTTHSTVAGSNYTPLFEDWQDRFSHAFTPWIMSQKLGNATKKLFKFHMLDAGQSGWDQVKVSIANISKSTDLSSDYGSFDVIIRSADDTDLDITVLQQFRSVNLNPSSDRYIARVIGDQNTFFEFQKDAGKQKLVTEGLYPNRSQYVRVQVNDQVESGMMEPTALPLGFAGKHHLVIDGETLAPAQGSTTFTPIKEPPLPYRKDVSVGSGATKVVDARFYWGLFNQNITNKSKRNQATGTTSLVSNLTKWYPSLGSHKVWVGDNKNAVSSADGESLDAETYNSNSFSLEKLWVKCLSADITKAVDPTMWHEAVYIRDGNTDGLVATGASGVYFQDAAGASKSSGYRYLDVSKDFGSSASKKFYKFTVPMQGGWDGLDIFDQSKSAMDSLSSFREMDTNTSTSLGGPNGPTTAAFRKALDILAEKSDVDIQLLATPGMRTAGITDYAIDKTEDRFDALYVLDMPAYDTSDNLVTTASQETSVSKTAQNLSNRNLDTSFAATYFPDLVMQDGSNNVVAPPSVAVLGALSLNDSVAHPWYAPAGFARGALASTIETSVKLNRTNMDVLYESDINPITSFPQTGESVIVFGQKTMLQAQSSLDRVNVRRLLIDVRRKVRTVANQILFEPNREATLARFSSLVNPILGRIQQQQGLDRYKVVIDTTTTTQQDVENNTIRGKIFLQPTKSIEFISLDFVVTNAGAEI